ncbi:MAG: uracil-DNA glycosylase [Anaerolineales bacterium]|nr:uracil-DNA glycosylase [Anaerolineales bacterium]MCB9127174.1 uracil-DNA glycosylase [Ardenticatenales bacterium]MCB9171934.1 uracil-DNA glycosylase [Ardenticatenales bacterium]
MSDYSQPSQPEDSLAAIAAEVRHCQRCPLAQGRRNAVPGVGPAQSAIMFIGEGPGGMEDQSGLPFVGPAGQYLDELLASIGLIREDVFITNVVKCRPPNNRDPEPDEIDSCKPYLVRQLRLVDPEIIVTLGRFAMERWLPDQRITKVHGQAFRFGRRLIVPMLHPAAALRRAEWRPWMIEDFQKLPHYIDEARRLRAGDDPNAPISAITPPPDAPQQSRLL